MDINYEPDPTDLVLSSVPGGELFNPRKHKFTEDELKPQPMIKKAKKVFVPEEQKVCDGKESFSFSHFIFKTSVKARDAKLEKKCHFQEVLCVCVCVSTQLLR